MTTDYATSADGVDWSWQGTVLSGRSGSWDARGVRVSSVVATADGLLAAYDGSASAAENWEEVTGVAVASRTPDGFEVLTAFDRPALRSRHAPGGLRYLSVLALDEDSYRVYYEYTRADGAHELRTELVTAAAEARRTAVAASA